MSKERDINVLAQFMIVTTYLIALKAFGIVNIDEYVKLMANRHMAV